MAEPCGSEASSAATRAWHSRLYSTKGGHARSLPASEPPVAQPLSKLVAIARAARYRAPLIDLARSDGVATGLRFGDGTAIATKPRDGVVLALPLPALGKLIPGLRGPAPGMAILNAHFRIAPGDAERAPPILGVLSAPTQWIFRRGDVVSVTVSAADHTNVWALDPNAALDLLLGGGRRWV